jgi:signal transduction histidine kinase
MSIRGANASAMVQPGRGPHVGDLTRWFGAFTFTRAGLVYTAAVSLAAFLACFLPAAAPSDDQTFAPLGVAVMVGWLLTVRLAPGARDATLLLVPVMSLDARVGLAGLPILAYTGVLANLARGVRGPRVLTAAAHATLAYLLAHQLSTLVALPHWAVFAVGFACLRYALGRLADRLETAQPHPRAEQPELALSLALAPVGALPLLVVERLGDGPLLLSMAALLALLFVVREATNLASARSEMESERDRLRRSNALQDDLIHLITHELRNPLTLVMSYSQMTRRASQDGSYDAIPGYIGNVERAGKSIQRLIENLLQLSRLERADGLPAPEPVEPGVLISQVVADLGPLAKQKQQTVIVKPTDGVPPVLAVPMLLRESLSNLVSNAVKYTPDGGEIVVWAEPGQQPGTALVGVADSGIGLSEDDVARLFTKFFRSSDPRVQRERGSGLGLALTHAMITRMGGRIEVTSALHKGTTFRLILPARQA